MSSSTLNGSLMLLRHHMTTSVTTMPAMSQVINRQGRSELSDWVWAPGRA